MKLLFPLSKNENFDGMIYEYFYDIPDLPFGVSIIKCQSWSFIENDNGWILSLCSWSNDWKLLDPVLEQVVQSFELTNKYFQILLYSFFNMLAI